MRLRSPGRAEIAAGVPGELGPAHEVDEQRVPRARGGRPPTRARCSPRTHDLGAEHGAPSASRP